VRRPGGYTCVTDPDGGRQECDTFTCAHCNRLTHVEARQKPEDVGGLCKACMGLICRWCVGHACVPFLKKLDQMEARDRALRSYGL